MEKEIRRARSWQGFWTGFCACCAIQIFQRAYLGKEIYIQKAQESWWPEWAYYTVFVASVVFVMFQIKRFES